ncbi:Yip1 family protein [Streptomyces sp. MST-110588]|uniref:Yip1 family protein n=1 Tax=Streptomyces sp. MST-110588 TaxID=2833628 RepID=UPI001F5E30A9|nr:Yip1 family protein [Streptomyces sp. MST-110588]UNO43998.1 YIP1 family protein [Streptomyces sp. MST-110588]
MGRGRNSRSAQHGQQQGQQAPYGQQGPYGQQPPPPHGQWQQPQQSPRAPQAPHSPQPYASRPGYGAPQQGGPHQGGAQHGGAQHGGRHGEPEYFGDDGYEPVQQSYAPYANDNNPGHTRQFSVGEVPDAYGPGPGGQYPDPYGDPYGNGGDSQYGDGGTYRAGQAAAAPVGPRLPWKQLLVGIVTRPGPTFMQMRDHPVWIPALIVSLVYGLLAVFGFDKAREDVLNATLSNSIPWVLITGIMFVVGSLILGAVTHTLARQLGGDGTWAPTIGLSMLIMAITDAPRLVFAMFLGGDSTLVQVLGWITWLASGFLFTTMVSKSHDLPWPRALGAASIQLVALLALLKLGTL